MTLNIPKTQALFPPPPFSVTKQTPGSLCFWETPGSQNTAQAATESFLQRHVVHGASNLDTCPRHFKASPLEASSKANHVTCAKAETVSETGWTVCLLSLHAERLKNLTVIPTHPLEVQDQNHSQRPSPPAEHPEFSGPFYFQWMQWRTLGWLHSEGLLTC